MTSEIRLIVGADGAELVVVGNLDAPPPPSDLVRTTARESVRQVTESVAVGLGDVAGIVLDVVEAFTSEVASRNFKLHGKMTVSFGVSGGANANLKLVGAKADAFINVQLEIPASTNSKEA